VMCSVTGAAWKSGLEGGLKVENSTHPLALNGHGAGAR
jgi:hypothetical protein